LVWEIKRSAEQQLQTSEMKRRHAGRRGECETAAWGSLKGMLSMLKTL